MTPELKSEPSVQKTIEESDSHSFTEHDIETAKRLKNKADYRENIVKAVKTLDSQQLLDAMQKLRYVLLELDKIENPEVKERKNSLHITNGHWQKQFDKFIETIQKQSGKTQKSPVYSDEIYFDGVSRFFIEITPDEQIKIIPSDVSNKRVKDLWDNIETANELYYGEGGDSAKSAIPLQLKELIEIENKK